MRAVGILGLLVVSGCGSCAASPRPGTTLPTERPQLFGERGSEALQGQPREVDYLVRGYQVAGDPQPANLGYYAYLVFSESGEDTKSRRLAAAKAFLSLVSVTPLDASSYPGPSEKVAILLAPIIGQGPLPRTPEELLERYDYNRGFGIWRDMTRSGLRVASVLIVGSPVPMFENEPLSSDVLVVELCDPSEAEARLIDFRDRLVLREDAVRSSVFSLLETMRTVFDALGGFMLASAQADTGTSGRCN